MIDARRCCGCAGIVVAILMLLTACGGRQSDWESARKADTAEAYTEFLKRYATGDFTSQARARLAELRIEADWANAIGGDSAQSYRQFLELHPDGARADEARVRLEILNRSKAPADTQPTASGQAEPAGIYRLQLGAFSSAQRAQSAWQQTLKSHPAQLAGLSYIVERTAVGNTTLFRLQSSGLSESKARAICAALKTAQQPCIVVLPQEAAVSGSTRY